MHTLSQGFQLPDNESSEDFSEKIDSQDPVVWELAVGEWIWSAEAFYLVGVLKNTFNLYALVSNIFGCADSDIIYSS